MAETVGALVFIEVVVRVVVVTAAKTLVRVVRVPTTVYAAVLIVAGLAVVVIVQVVVC